MAASQRKLKRVGTHEVLTLAEAAGYLRVSESIVGKLARQRRVPAQRIGGEWRFLRSALDAWLGRSADATRNGSPPDSVISDIVDRLFLELETKERRSLKRSSKEKLLSLAGRWKNDPTLDELLAQIYKRRGRPMIQERE